MQITVIIPTYNRARRLAIALRSVLNQSFPPHEVIVVDDGSSDETPWMVRSQFPEVRHIRQMNRGVSSARNAGIQAARGDWLAFLDSDDQWLPRKLESQNAALTTQPTYRVCHTEEIWVRRGRRVNPMKKHTKHGGWIFENCLPRCVISPSSVMIHRGVFADIGLFDEDLPACEDYDLWLRICSRYPVLFCSQPLITKYGGHDDQLSRRFWGMDRFRIAALEKLIARGDLDSEQYLATLDTLLDKIDIVLAGARKRGNAGLAKALVLKLSRYQRLRSKCKVLGQSA